MKPLWIIALLAVPLALRAANAPTTNAAPATNAPAAAPRRLDFDAFKLVTERNVFNGNRSGQRLVARSAAQRVVKVDSFTLVGTMSSAKGELAFFDGSDTAFRKALRAHEELGAFRVLEVWPAGVRLGEGTNEFALRVGAALRREDEGRWHYAEAGTYANGSAASWGRPAANDAPAAPAGSAAEVNDVLRRLMEKREKENQ